MKLFAAFFVVLLAVHASTQTPISDDSSTTKQVVVEVLQSLLKVTSALLDSANDFVDDLKLNEKEYTEKLATLVAKELQTFNGIFVALVNELEDGATDQGKAVLACIDAEQDKLDAAILKTIETIANNGLSEFPLITDLLDVILSQSSELQEAVKLQTDSLETCDSSDAICFAAFATTAVKIFKQISDNIEEDYDILVTVVKAISSDIAAWDVRGLVQEDIQTAFNDIVLCIYR